MLAGFASPRVKLTRVGTVVDHYPNVTEPVWFRHLVGFTNITAEQRGSKVLTCFITRMPFTLSINRCYRARLIIGCFRQANTRTYAPDWQPLASTTDVILMGEENAEEG